VAAKKRARARVVDNRRHVSVYLRVESVEQLHQLADALHISRSAIMAQAIARMHRDEPLLRGRRLPRAKPVVTA
jgi:hypothetical protein